MGWEEDGGDGRGVKRETTISCLSSIIDIISHVHAARARAYIKYYSDASVHLPTYTYTIHGETLSETKTLVVTSTVCIFVSRRSRTDTVIVKRRKEMVEIFLSPVFTSICIL